MPKRKVAVGYITFLSERENPVTGDKQVVPTTANYGEVVDIPAGEIKRLEYQGKELGQDLIASSDTDLAGGEPGESAPEEFDASEAGADELLAYLEENKPNVPATIALAQDDPEVAERLIEAEENYEGRTGVLEKLERIAESEEE